MKRLVLAIVVGLCMALLLGARGPAHGQAATALASVGERASTVCDEASIAGAALNHAGLVVAFDGGRTETYCIEFSEDEISGAELLDRSGLEIVFSSGGGFGAGICKIEGTGCNEPTDCFCQCRGSSCAYWSYWTRQDGNWRYQQFGASQREVRDGDVDAWVWGNGRSAPPGAGGVCPTVTPSPPRAQPTPTMAPPPTSRGPATAPADRPTNAPTSATTQRSIEGGTTPTAGTAATTVESAPIRTAAAIVRSDASVTATPRNNASASPGDDSSDRNAPVGIIAFGVVAGTLVLAIGGIAVRRRFGG